MVFLGLPLLIFFALSAVASPSQGWLIGTTELVVVSSPYGGLVNPSCLQQPSCQAAIALKSKHRASFASVGGKNPGSTVCKDRHHGKVVIAKRGPSTQGFCVFSDGSFASLDGLLL